MVFLTRVTGGHIQLHQERAQLRFLAKIVRRGGLWGGVRDSKGLGRFLAMRVLGQEGCRGEDNGCRVFRIVHFVIFLVWKP